MLPCITVLKFDIILIVTHLNMSSSSHIHLSELSFALCFHIIVITATDNLYTVSTSFASKAIKTSFPANIRDLKGSKF